MGAAALYGASKMMGKTPFEHEGSIKLPDNRMAMAKKEMTKDKAYKLASKKSKTYNSKGVMKLDESDLKKFSLKKDGTDGTRNMKSIFVNDDGSLTVGTNKYKNKEAYTLELDRFAEVLNGETKGKEAISGQSFDMTKALTLPTMGAYILELK